ncbi:unnamed protein product [Nezara viridula]|uniref:Innexin n=1 Tax=Nezara viridula TaxID=85310 RepID=A0A9P0H8F8_NEZVI|nr:unnamed protein product [Nezara viridula]
MLLNEVEDILREFYGSWNIGHTNFVFKLHYLVSFYLLTIFILASSVQLFAKNYVNCVGTKGETENHIDKFAYYFYTFTRVEDKYGVLKNDMVVHSYYFWVPVLFIYHLFVFRWTYYVWQGCGGKLLRKLDEDKNKAKMFAIYIEQRVKHKLNDKWLFQLVFLELQNICVCVHQWITTNYILNGKFYQLGLDLSFENLKKIFPYETKFTFTTYGPSGSIQEKDYMCILGLNALYKYIFSFYWWWLVILTTLTVLNIIMRIALIKYRPLIWFWEKNKETWLLTDKRWFISLRYSDWLFMKYLQEAVSLRKYRYVVRLLADPDLRRLPGEDSSPESSDENGSEEDTEEHEERERYRELLRTIMHPIPMLTNGNNGGDGRSGELRFRARGRHSGQRASERPIMLELLPRPTSIGHYKGKVEPIPEEESIPESRNEDIEVLVYTPHPDQNQTNADGERPEADPLLGAIPDSETGSSKSDESDGVQLNVTEKNIQYKPHKKN